MNPISAHGHSSQRAGWTSVQYRFPSRYRIVWVAIIALVAVALIDAPNVLGRDSLGVLTALGGVLAIASLGQLLVVAQGGIDLSVPAILATGAAVVVKEAGSVNTVVLVIVACLVCGIAGTLNAVLIVVARINPVIATLATSTAFAGILLLWTGNSFSLSGKVPPGVGDVARGHLGALSYIGIIAIVITIIVSLMLRKTEMGRNFLVVGSNAYAARVLGIGVRRYQVTAYAAAGLLYGMAGVLLAGYLGQPNATIGASYQLTVIVVVALSGAAFAGGSGSPAGVLAAGFFVMLLRQYLASKGMSAGVQVLVDGAALIVAVALVTLSSVRHRRGGRRRQPAGPQPPVEATETVAATRSTAT